MILLALGHWAQLESISLSRGVKRSQALILGKEAQIEPGGGKKHLELPEKKLGEYLSCIGSRMA